MIQPSILWMKKMTNLHIAFFFASRGADGHDLLRCWHCHSWPPWSLLAKFHQVSCCAQNCDPVWPSMTQYDPVWPSPISIHSNTCNVVGGCPLMSRPRAATSVAISTLLSLFSHIFWWKVWNWWNGDLGARLGLQTSHRIWTVVELPLAEPGPGTTSTCSTRHRHGGMFQNDDGPRTGQSIHRHALGALVVRWLCSKHSVF